MVVAMDLSDPVTSVAPGIHSRILVSLWRSAEPLSGRAVARLVAGYGARQTVEKALDELVRQGVVRRAEVPPAALYTLNREHVAAEVLPVLAELRDHLWQRVRAGIRDWRSPPSGAYLFGSAARGEGGMNSDIDVLVVYATSRAADAGEDEQSELAESIARWSGNRAQIVTMTLAEVARAAAGGERLVADIERDAIPLVGPSFRRLIAVPSQRRRAGVR